MAMQSAIKTLESKATFESKALFGDSVRIVIGGSLLTPLGFFGFMLVPLWLIVVGLWLSRDKTTSPPPIRS